MSSDRGRRVFSPISVLILLLFGTFSLPGSHLFSPRLSSLSYFGKSGSDSLAKAAQKSGYLYVAGTTDSDGLATPGAFQKHPGLYGDVFVSKIEPSGRVVFRTYLGGNGLDEVGGLDVDSAGNVWVVGRTTSTNFPTRNAFQSYKNPFAVLKIFVTKLNATGTDVLFSTYMGRDQNGYDQGAARGVAINGNGDAYITGYTSTTNFPVTAGLTKDRNDVAADTVIFKMSADGQSLLYSTYFGGSGGGFTAPSDLDLIAGSEAAVVGWTFADSLVLVKPLQKRLHGRDDGYFVKLDETGHVAFSSYWGGDGSDRATAVAAGAAGKLLIAGETSSLKFPVLNGFLMSPAGGSDGFISEISADGSQLVYSSYLGGHDNEYVSTLAVDELGYGYVGGATTINYVPDPEEENPTAFISVVSPSGRYLVHSVSTQSVFIRGIAIGAMRNITAVGVTESQALSTRNATQPSYGGGPFDGFIAKYEFWN